VYKKVLVPLDGSTLSELALANAFIIASACQDSELVLLHVVEPFKDLAHWVSEDVARRMQKEATRVAQKYLDSTIERLGKEDIQSEAVITQGNPGEAILEYAAKAGVDLIVMGTHGRTGLNRLLFGSVAARVIQYSHLPVLLVPPGSLASKK
jgi:nucleotide-binding universal stress UspA family protein